MKDIDIEKKEKIEATENLLTSIYQNTKTAIQSIDDIMPSIECDSLVKELSEQSSNYTIISQECEVLAKSIDMNLKDNNWFEKIKLWSSIKMSTVVDKTTSHITEMLLLGTFMGVVTCLKDSTQYSNADEEILNLLTKLQKLEEENIENLKTFL